MTDSQQPANDAEPLPESDPEIEALLNFEPVPRARIVEGSWTPELQREFITRLATHGSIQWACDEMGKNRTGVTRLRKHRQAGSFNAAIDGAIALARRRMEEMDRLLDRMEPLTGATPPPATIDYRRRNPLAPPAGRGGLPGQILNEHGEYEDEDSYHRRAEEAKDSIGMKLVRCRRAYLAEISTCPGKRAAFEILAELPVDWEKAERLEPQPFEPWTRTNQRQPDMVLTAESGWSFGEIGYGPDKKAEARAAIDRHRAKEGLPAVDWSEDASRGVNPT